ncbi:TetR/AcrR family transcriptional regulator [Gorillibacterium sp. sgz5001074]|uniref:TetR/AcrR family transcriptional regulator n=1 Tax=Gorillibacterium sp. sgz5001074 TaxID=3446695 RepID=UPI003F6749D9
MPMRKDAAEHRRLILQTAQHLFTEYGADSVSMHQIAKTSGIGQGTLYRNYSNKADLCLDMIRESSRQLEQDIQDMMAGEPTISVRDKLDGLVTLIVGFIEEKSQWLGAVQTSTCPDGGSTYYRSPIYESGHSRIRHLLQEAVDRGECPSDLDTVFAADSLLSLLDPDLYLFLRRVRGYTTEAYLQNVRSVFLNPLFRQQKG